MPQNVSRKPNNPIATFNRAWKIVERIFTAVALTMVIGTIGFVSLHLLA
jgi:predicted RND superfamily exporter protein